MKQIYTKVVPDVEWKGMYRVKWPDKVLSLDMYNISWAKEHSKAVNDAIRESYEIRPSDVV